MSRHYMPEDPQQVLVNTDQTIRTILGYRFESDTRKFFQLNKLNNILSNIILKSTCSYETAIDLRRETWGFDILGVTEPVPWEQWETCPYDMVPQDRRENSLITEVSSQIWNSTQNIKSTPGPFAAYFGSLTQEKIIHSKIELENPSPFLRSLKNLLYIKSWTERLRYDHLTKLVEGLVDDKLKILEGNIKEIDLYHLEDKSYGGNLFHRFRSVIASRGALINNNGYLTTLIRTPSSNLSDVMRGGEDWNIQFQLIYLYLQCVISDLIVTEGNYSSFLRN